MKFVYIILFTIFCFIIKYTITNPDSVIVIKSIMRFLLIKTTTKSSQQIIINKYKDIVKLPFDECQLILWMITYRQHKILRFYCGIDKFIVND